MNTKATVNFKRFYFCCFCPLTGVLLTQSSSQWCHQLSRWSKPYHDITRHRFIIVDNIREELPVNCEQRKKKHPKKLHFCANDGIMAVALPRDSMYWVLHIPSLSSVQCVRFHCYICFQGRKGDDIFHFCSSWNWLGASIESWGLEPSCWTVGDGTSTRTYFDPV